MEVSTPDSTLWEPYFRRRHAEQVEATNGVMPSGRLNADGRHRWWGEDVLEYIEGGNTPRLEYPAPPTFSRRRGSSWTPRRMDPASSSSSGRSSGSPSLLPIKPEPQDTPISQRTHNSSVRIAESSPTSTRLVRPKVEPGLRTEYEAIVLRSFKELRSLRIELPTGELGIDDGVLLKWKADFGSTLGSCVILGASSVSSKPLQSPMSSPNAEDSEATSLDDNREPEELASIPESLHTNGGLKLRVVWTISSLIAASARHYLLQPIIADHEMLDSLNLTDADGQGVLTMDKKQLQELRVRPVSVSGNSHRTLMPALIMRLWSCYD
ncbi:hypothetical protein TRIUR3_22704 [Triticum urartu]|uniref:Uncharacterized protein n=1 Tax=Triticum urartu TaxID=4572 RepID=M7YI89_TRIUA|nr:hypothetical protein TRIUR3_22704 [Triticum urartu]